MVPDTNVDDILKKYGRQIEDELNTDSTEDSNYSQSYLKFKKEMSPEISRYERWAKSLGSVIRLKISEKDEARIKKSLDISHLDL